MKTIIYILLLTFQYCLTHAQITSPGLDALIDNSKVIVQGVIILKKCHSPMNVSSLLVEKCVITMNVENVIKGNPLLSNLEILRNSDSNTHETARLLIQLMYFALNIIE